MEGGDGMRTSISKQIARDRSKQKVTDMSTRVTTKTKFESYGEEMIEKQVKESGTSGRVYLPSEWVGKKVKIIRID